MKRVALVIALGGGPALAVLKGYLAPLAEIHSSRIPRDGRPVTLEALWVLLGVLVPFYMCMVGVSAVEVGRGVVWTAWRAGRSAPLAGWTPPEASAGGEPSLVSLERFGAEPHQSNMEQLAVFMACVLAAGVTVVEYVAIQVLAGIPRCAICPE